MEKRINPVGKTGYKTTSTVAAAMGLYPANASGMQLYPHGAGLLR